MILENDSRFKQLELKIGLFVLLALFGCMAAIFFVGLQSDLFSSKYSLHFIVDKGTGFSKGMPVKLSGFRIGRIESISLTDQARVEVRLQIDQKYQVWIRQDSVARLVKEGLVGDSVIEIAVGAPTLPMLQNDSLLAYEKSKGIEDHVAGLADQVKPVLADVGAIITYVNDPQGDIKQTLGNLKGLTRELQTTRSKADLLIDGSRSDINSITRKVGTLLDQAEVSLGTLNSSLQRLDHTMTTVDQKIPEILSRVDRTLAHLEKVSGDLQTITPRVSPLVNQASSSIDDTGEVLRAVKDMWPIKGHLAPIQPPQLIEGGSHE